MVKGYTYTLSEMATMGKLTDEKVCRSVKKGGINAGLGWRKVIQRSLTQHNKSLDMNTQMELVHVTQTIERYCRPFIYRKHFINIRMKYPEISEQKAKNLANEKTEKTIKKYSY